MKSLDIMKVLASQDSLELFTIIAKNNDINSRLLQSKSKLTGKRYYSGVRRLIACSLVRRKSKNLSLTTFGQAVNDLKVKMDSIVNESYRLKAVDVIMDLKGMGEKERMDLIGKFIKDIELRSILMGRMKSGST
ncbi:MAG TPA: hypothetical protein VH415_16025 [Nitrososphaeraceae archaeon]